MAKTQERKVTQTIKFILAPAEIEEMARNAGTIDEEINRDEKEFKTVKKDWSAKIKHKQKTRGEILAAIVDGEQERDVDCIEVMNWEDSSVTYYDLNEPRNELSTRAMSEEEKQMGFDIDEESAPKRTRKSKNNVVSADFAAPSVSDESAEVRDVIREETSRHTKRSSVDSIHDELPM